MGVTAFYRVTSRGLRSYNHPHRAELMRHQQTRVLACFAVLLALSLDTRAGDASMPTFVPWKVLNAGDDPLKTDLVLYWLPRSREEIRRSPLLTSRALAIASTQCVGMQIIRPDDDENIARFGATGTLPMAVLATSDGTMVEVIVSEHGMLSVSNIEKMVREQLANRAADVDRLLDMAKDKLEEGDREMAIIFYRRVCAQRCLFPRKAKDAQKALHRLGVDER